MINIKNPKEIEIMLEGGKILAKILDKLSKSVKPGISTWSLEELARKLTKKADAEPAFLGYNGYPAFLCVSMNEEIVHSLPSERIIRPGDLVSLDFGIKYKGFNVDSAATLLVSGGDDRELKKRLLRVTKECLDLGISKARAGNAIGDISSAIQKHAEENSFSIVRDLVGHGIGLNLHEEPEVPNFGIPGKDKKLEEGMTIAIEPMLAAGHPEVRENKKTLAWETKDSSLSAHFEHTVAITKKGPLVLTE